MKISALLTTSQAARELGLSERRIRILCSTGRLGQRVGSRYVISRRDLERFRALPREPGRPAASAR